MTKILYIPTGSYIEFYTHGYLFEEYAPGEDAKSWLNFFCVPMAYPRLKEQNNILKDTKLSLSEFELIYD